MAYNRKHISQNGSFQISQKQSLLKTFDEVASGTVNPQTAPVALTAATGTPSNSVVDVTSSFVQATLNNNFKAVSDKINALRTALIAAGVLK